MCTTEPSYHDTSHTQLKSKMTHAACPKCPIRSISCTSAWSTRLLHFFLYISPSDLSTFGDPTRRQSVSKGFRIKQRVHFSGWLILDRFHKLQVWWKVLDAFDDIHVIKICAEGIIERVFDGFWGVSPMCLAHRYYATTLLLYVQNETTVFVWLLRVTVGCIGLSVRGPRLQPFGHTKHM
jgi:hypothetical protein